MRAGDGSKLERRVVRAAEAALAERQFVTAIDVLVGLGWLEPRRVQEWRQGRVDCLERVVVASLGKISTAMRCFRRWARKRGLKPSETVYVARTRGRQVLQFSRSGDPEIERAYRTHWVSPELSGPSRSSPRSRRRGGSRSRGRRQLDEDVERTEAQRLAEFGWVDWVDWGGELIWAVGFTSGGAPYGLRTTTFRSEL
ncbi:MAG: hypothetical protein ACLP8S_25825 [Solirubrobacteraceae bacterium]